MEVGKNKRQTNTVKRHYHLDWLRVIAILAVFLLHCGKIFDYHTTVVVNNARSPFLSIFREYILLWVMPLFFVISGAAVSLVINQQTTKRFMISRIKRLLIPSILVGTFVINPVYVYMERLSAGKTSLSFWLWYPHFFDGMYLSGNGNFAFWGVGTHIWYLMYLFIFSFLLLPLFRKSKKAETSPLVRLSRFFEKPVNLALLFIPVSAFSWFFEYIGLSDIRMTGHWDVLSYMMFLIFGYMIYANEMILRTIRRVYPVFLVVAGLGTVIYLCSHFGILIKINGVTMHDLSTGRILKLNHSVFALVQAFRGLVAWSWMIAILGLGQQFLNRENIYRFYANEAVLPFYILHHPVIYVVAYYILRTTVGVALKYSLIAGLSFVIIIVVYELLIRRWNPVRVLFGMKPG